MLTPEPYIRLLKYYAIGFTLGYITVSGLLKISDVVRSVRDASEQRD
jgi:hypothetical protein